MEARKKVIEGSKAEGGNAWDPRSVLEMSQQALQSWARCVSAVSEHVGQFVQTRWHDDMDAWNRLAACRDPRAWLECQREYFEKSASDYLTESGELVRLAFDTARDGFAALRPSGGETARPREMAAD